jgi:hypothetical protein
MKSTRFAEILRLLAEHQVEAIVVGMLAGVLQGSPLTTADVDIVHRRTPENVKRLLAVLNRVGAVYRHDPRRIAPSESHLLGPGHQLLETTLGDLDCLGAIDDGKTYDDLILLSFPIDLGDGRMIRVLSLEALIEVKARAGRPKDLAAIPVLESTREERDRRGKK